MGSERGRVGRERRPWVDKSDGDKIEAQGRKGEMFMNGEYQKLEGNLPPTLSLKQWCEQADQGMRNGLKQVGL